MERTIKSIAFIITTICCVAIRSYQLVIRPMLGQHCRFVPSCSQYALQAFRYYGPLQALWFTLRRLLRCHPWAKAGYDPILPHQKET